MLISVSDHVSRQDMMKELRKALDFLAMARGKRMVIVTPLFLIW